MSFFGDDYWQRDTTEMAELAFQHALCKNVEGAAEVLGQIGYQYGTAGLMQAMLGFVDTYIDHMYENDPGPVAGVALAINAITGQAESDLGKFKPELNWATRLVYARLAQDEDRWYKVCSELENPQEAGRHILYLLEVVAGTMNALPRGSGNMGSDCKIDPSLN